eukprot:jgi/Chlat1/1089/Chrsp110S08641
MERSEHELVISAIEKLPTERRCYRLVGGVLVERNVGEVLPAVRRNRDSLVDVIGRLQSQTQSKNAELQALATKYKIRVRSRDEADSGGGGGGGGGGATQGVLVGAHERA